mmetsp:Transcript_48391/g.83122  ORF Transcript_48391/g.83122 Transcript_48391/m.83122 type:complete len:192 (-) Transcript_48391:130-705(-)|eukprot:CAMPEP_0194571648 /NCGR_PEP_ID=MMETSP0292-20121207/8554_1 /TAXON_ID=39354 /ORGANISM="Heterosigma akashiwo, Strain CCMP2393" /LENGTH=191 /DNA_ID=CAMNT_0039422489 /DNA_START=34 /DNA_END=609 /DNA_ORIENTATION=+
MEEDKNQTDNPVSAREEMVNRAVNFLLHPKVLSTSTAKKVEFLESKNLTPQEIAQALKKAEQQQKSMTQSSQVKNVIQRSGGKENYSAVVKAGGLAYFSGLTASNLDGTSVEDQTREVLEKADKLLNENKLHKKNVISASIWLKNISEGFQPFNSVWRTWVDPKNLPARATVQAEMADPRILVEIQLIIGC